MSPTATVGAATVGAASACARRNVSKNPPKEPPMTDLPATHETLLARIPIPSGAQLEASR